MEPEQLLSKNICRRILKFFMDNPALIDTARGISTWINREEEEVEPALRKLEEHGFLAAHRTSSTAAYSLSSDKSVLSRIKKLLNKKPGGKAGAGA